MLFPLSIDLNLGKRKNAHDAISGEYGGWGSRGFMRRNYCKKRSELAEALSW
jgi:hypothetical protein